MYCEKCGAKLNDGDAFCRACGTHLKNVNNGKGTMGNSSMSQQSKINSQTKKGSTALIIGVIVAAVLLVGIVIGIMLYTSYSKSSYLDELIDNAEKIAYRRDYNRGQDNSGTTKWSEDVIVIDKQSYSSDYKCTSQTVQYEGVMRNKDKDRSNYSYSISDEKVDEFKELLKQLKDVSQTEKYIEANDINVDVNDIDNVMILVHYFEHSGETYIELIVNSDLIND